MHHHHDIISSSLSWVVHHPADHILAIITSFFFFFLHRSASCIWISDTLSKQSLEPLPTEKKIPGTLIVIGAGSGIGKATAHRVAKEGAHVVCADLSEEAAQATAEELIESYGIGIGVAGTGISGCGPALGLAVDITKRTSIRSMFENVILAYGGIDNIIITAGIFVPPDIQGYISDDKWALTYAINVTGPYLVADEAKKDLAGAGTEGQPCRHDECQCCRCQAGLLRLRHSKAAANHLVRELAIELSPLVRVNGLAPATVVEGSSMFPRDRVISSLVKYKIDI